jgi:hypothetical protein
MNKEGLADIQLFEWTADGLLPLARKAVAYRWEDDECHRLFAWSPDSLEVASAFGITEQKDPWRVEWVKKVTLGSICVDSLKFSFEELRPGILLWDIGLSQTDLPSFPTLTDATTSLRWLGDSGLLAAASADGRILLWDASPARVGEMQAWNGAALVALGCLIMSARRLRHRPRTGIIRSWVQGPVAVEETFS